MECLSQLMLCVVCGPAMVDSISIAQKLRGCTVIQGALEIQIRGGSKLNSLYFLVMSGDGVS